MLARGDIVSNHGFETEVRVDDDSGAENRVGDGVDGTGGEGGDG